MVPGILPSQLGSLSKGRTYIETTVSALFTYLQVSVRTVYSAHAFSSERRQVDITFSRTMYSPKHCGTCLVSNPLSCLEQRISLRTEVIGLRTTVQVPQKAQVRFSTLMKPEQMPSLSEDSSDLCNDLYVAHLRLQASCPVGLGLVSQADSH